MSVLEQIAKHYKSLPVRSIEVPEWPDDEGKPLVIQWKPWSITEKKLLHQVPGADDITSFVEVIILKALDADGNKMFTNKIEARDTMRRRAHEPVIVRIAMQILADLNETDDAAIEEAEGN